MTLSEVDDVEVVSDASSITVIRGESRERDKVGSGRARRKEEKARELATARAERAQSVKAMEEIAI